MSKNKTPNPPTVWPQAVNLYIKELEKTYKSPVVPHYNAISFLAAMAVAVGNGYKLKVEYEEHISCIWGALVGTSSSGKSEVMKTAFAPLTYIQTILSKQFENSVEEFGEAKNKKLHPKSSTMYFTDTTVEGVYKASLNNKMGLVGKYDELKTWFGGMDRYSRGDGDRSQWLALWNSGSAAINRSSGIIFIEMLLVSVVGGLVPEEIEVFKKHIEDGLLARFLVVVTEKTRIELARHGKAYRPLEYKKAYNEFIQSLWLDSFRRFIIEPPACADEADVDNFDDATVGRFSENGWPEYELNEAELLPLINKSAKPIEIGISSKAIGILNDLKTEIENEMNSAVDSGETVKASWLGKLHVYVYRFALILHVVWSKAEGVEPSKVGVKDMKRAIELYSYFKAHMSLCYDTLFNPSPIQQLDNRRYRMYFELAKKQRRKAIEENWKGFTPKEIKLICRQVPNPLAERSIIDFYRNEKLFTYSYGRYNCLYTDIPKKRKQ